MKDEIKEILDWLERENLTNILDYITKLQDKIKQLQEELKYSIPQVQHNQIVSKLAEEKHILQEENKNLKQINEEHRELNGSLRTANSTLCEVEDFMYNQAKEYKTRIDKAIEYINKSEYATIESYKHIHADDEGKVYNLDVLLNILQGSDE